LKLLFFKPVNTRDHLARGFTLIEVMIVIAIIGILASIGIPNFIKYREKARVAAAITEIQFIQKAIAEFSVENGMLPANLAEVEMNELKDPWGRPYQYYRMTGTNKDTGNARKDQSLVPINSDYDLYSMGKDGMSPSPLTSAESQDDVIRANNGGFIGLGSNY
jgi:general secretion pathway protein G